MSAGEPPNPDDYYEHYADHLEAAGKSIRTIEYFETSASYFEDFLEKEGTSEEEITPRVAMRLKSFLDTPDRNEETIKWHMTQIGGMYEYYNKWGTFDANPIWLAMDDIEWNISDNTSRIDIPLAEMKEAIKNTEHFLSLALVVLLLKTGIRNGEAVNLDLRDINIDHEFSDKLLPTPRSEIKSDQDTLYIDANVERGDIVNRRLRTASNKRKRSTKIPIDGELKSVLIYWLIARPPTICPADPIFVRTNGPNAGDRHGEDSLKWEMRKWAKEQGWYKKGAGERNNVTAQYCRHFFTTHMRRRVNNDEIGGNEAKYFVKGIRGDTGDDVIDTYTQNWGNYVRQAYKNNIYSLFD